MISHGKILILFEVIDEDNFVEDEESFDGDHSWPALTNAKIQLVRLGSEIYACLVVIQLRTRNFN